LLTSLSAVEPRLCCSSRADHHSGKSVRGVQTVSDSKNLKLDVLCETSIQMFTPQQLATAELADFCRVLKSPKSVKEIQCTVLGVGCCQTASTNIHCCNA